jgi:hypothetical protein
MGFGGCGIKCEMDIEKSIFRTDAQNFGIAVFSVFVI